MESDCRLGHLDEPQPRSTQIGEIESLSCQEKTEGQNVKTEEHHQNFDDKGGDFHIDQNVRNEENQRVDGQDSGSIQLQGDQNISHVVRSQVVEDDQDVRNLSDEGGSSGAALETQHQREEAASGGKKFRCNLCNFSCLTHGAYGQFLLTHVNFAVTSIINRPDICPPPPSPPSQLSFLDHLIDVLISRWSLPPQECCAFRNKV